MIDLRNKTYYHYKNFSDTANLIAKWEEKDTASFYKYGMAWIFYRENTGLMVPAQKPTQLPDTIRNGIKYQRLKFPLASNGKDSTWITAFFRCDKKKNHVSI